MIDHERVGDSLLATVPFPGEWRKPLPTADDAEAVVAYVAARLQTPGVTISRDHLDAVLSVPRARGAIKADVLDEDDGYGRDSYFGRAMNKDD